MGFAASTAVLAVALGWTLLAPENELPPRVERFSLSISENHTPDEQLNISPDGSMMVFRALNVSGGSSGSLTRTTSIVKIRRMSGERRNEPGGG